MYELGARMMTLTWNYPNELAAPNANPGGPLVANTTPVRPVARA